MNSTDQVLVAFYDYRLVALSVIIAILAAYAALDLAGRITSARGQLRFVWLIGGSLAMGLGIWSMHYIGMLAFHLPIPVLYDWPTVLLSLLAAILASGIALFVVSGKEMGLIRASIGGIFMGVGIAAMHYIGMAAMRLSAMHHWSRALVVLSVVLAIVISFLAILVTFYFRGNMAAWSWRKIGSSVLMGGAIPIMHYTGMAAATFTAMTPPLAHSDTAHAVSVSSLSIAGITVITFLVLGLAGITSQVDRRFYAQALELEASARLAAIVESSEDAIVSKSLDGIVRSWNRAAERLYGYAATEMIGRPMTLLLPPDRPDEEAIILESLRRGVRLEHFETVRLRKDGKTIDVSLTVSPIYDKAGNVRGASHIARDISERRQAEVQRLHAQKLESLGVLAGGVAHDFNNLLTGILGNASLAADAMPASNPNRRVLEECITAAERAAQLTRQLLAYAGKGRFVTEAVNLSVLVREISALVQTSIPRKVQVRLELADDLPLIEADTGQLQQVIMNLVINGAEAIGDHVGLVVCATGAQVVDEAYRRTLGVEAPGLAFGTYVTLEVHDSGCGMDEATMSRIFDPFFTTKFTGRGLGLAAVLGIVRGHKGALKVYSAPGKGSTFKLLFPALDRAAAIPLQADLCRDLHGAGTVLIVDDESAVRSTARNTLERYGYRVLEAADGREALDIFKHNADQISLVLLDLTMPYMSGEEVLRELKLISPSVQVLLSSGFNEVDAVRRFTGKGLAGFLQKPYTSIGLAESVKKVLQG
jgi:PAS domain S-box-containing protein